MARVNIVTEDASGLVAASKLPLATSSTKGAVMPVAATAAMTQDVGVKSDGTLVTEPGGGGGGGVGYDLHIYGAHCYGGTCLITINDSEVFNFYSTARTINGIAIPSTRFYVESSGGTYQEAVNEVASGAWYGGASSLYDRFGVHFSNVKKIKIEMTNTEYANMARFTINGVTYSKAPLTYEFNITQTTILYVSNAWCLHPDTNILLNGNVEKPIKDIRDGDEILSVDERGEIVTDRVINCDSHLEKYGDETDVWTFDDGTVLKTIHPHEFFSADEQRFKYIADFKTGERIVKADGTKPALVKHDIIPGKARHMTLFTERYNTYFANGVLTGNRHSVKFTKEM